MFTLLTSTDLAMLLIFQIVFLAESSLFCGALSFIYYAVISTALQIKSGTQSRYFRDI